MRRRVEVAAERAQAGDPAYEQAKAFNEEQQQSIEHLRGQQDLLDPQEAGDTVARTGAGKSFEAATAAVPQPTVPPLTPAPRYHETGVPLTEGQATGNLQARKLEVAAERAQAGNPAYEQAKAFNEEQQQSIEHLRGQQDLLDPQEAGDTVARHLRNTALDQQADEATRAANLDREREAVRGSFEPNGRVVAASPQEAADIIGASVTRAEEQAHAARDAAYDDFAHQGGTFEPHAFANVGRDIRRSLNVGTEPFMLNPKTTPLSIGAIRDVDQSLGAAARSAMDPEVKSFPALTPQSIENTRKRLVAFRRQAESSARATGDMSDVAGLSRIQDAFDTMVTGALRDPELFNGDGAAVANSIDTARGLHSDLRRTFSGTGGDVAASFCRRSSAAAVLPLPVPRSRVLCLVLARGRFRLRVGSIRCLTRHRRNAQRSSRGSIRR